MIYIEREVIESDLPYNEYYQTATRYLPLFLMDKGTNIRLIERSEVQGELLTYVPKIEGTSEIERETKTKIFKILELYELL
jgi:hypothetical protein